MNTALQSLKRIDETNFGANWNRREPSEPIPISEARSWRIRVTLQSETTSSALAASIPVMNSPAFRKLAEIASLQDGWDGEDADAPTAYAIARSFYLTDLIRLGTGGIEPIASMPLPDGGLQLEWQLPHGNFRYELEVAPDGELSLARIEEHDEERIFDLIGTIGLRDAAERIAHDLAQA